MCIFLIFYYFPGICCGQGAVICSTLVSRSRRNRCIEFKENIADGELWMRGKKLKVSEHPTKSTKHKAIIQNWGYWYDCVVLKSRYIDWHLAYILSIVTTRTDTVHTAILFCRFSGQTQDRISRFMFSSLISDRRLTEIWLDF